MAYARIGEDGSDIYLYATSTGKAWVCAGCSLGRLGTDIYFTNYGDLGLHLLTHVSKGHCVPERVFDRLFCEMEGLPWETDVVRVLKGATGNEGECICRTPSCGHKARQHSAEGVCEVCREACWQ